MCLGSTCVWWTDGRTMPLVWANVEHLKLQRSIHDGCVYDMPLQARQRYVIEQRRSPYAFWRFNHKRRSLPPGQRLRVETVVPTLIHWSVDGWRTTHDTDGRATGIGIYVTDLPTETLPTGARVEFTFYWPDVDRWEQRDFTVIVG